MYPPLLSINILKSPAPPSQYNPEYSCGARDFTLGSSLVISAPEYCQVNPLSVLNARWICRCMVELTAWPPKPGSSQCRGAYNFFAILSYHIPPSMYGLSTGRDVYPLCCFFVFSKSFPLYRRTSGPSPFLYITQNSPSITTRQTGKSMFTPGSDPK